MSWIKSLFIPRTLKFWRKYTLVVFKLNILVLIFLEQTRVSKYHKPTLYPLNHDDSLLLKTPNLVVSVPEALISGRPYLILVLLPPHRDPLTKDSGCQDQDCELSDHCKTWKVLKQILQIELGPN